MCKQFITNRLPTGFAAPGCVALATFFSLGTALADFTLLMRDATTSINNTTAAEDLLAQPSSPSGGWTFVDSTVSRDVIDVAGGGGNFGTNNPLPNGTTGTGGANYALKATANVIIPAGTWTVGFGSDDGGVIKIPGVTFTSRFRTNGTQKSVDEARFEGTRGHNWTGGTFTVDSAFQTTIEAIMFEKGDGDSFEVGFAQGAQPDRNGNWQLMQDGVFGWTIQVAPLEDLEAPVVTELSPADGATGVFRQTDLVVTFDEAIALTPASLAGSLNVTITDNTPADGTINYAVPLNDPSVSVDGTTITIGSPGVLQVENNYTVQIEAGAIQDMSVDNGGGANILGTAITWSFTTPTLDPNPPVVLSTSPQDDAILVRLDEVLTATFDRGVAIGSGNIYIYDVEGAVNFLTIDVTDDSQVIVSGENLIIDLNQPLDHLTEYAVRWDAGAVQNYTDVPCAVKDDNGWSFTTSTASLANSIIITNPSFEADTLGDNGYSAAAEPENWVLEVDAGSVQFSWVWNPPTTWTGFSYDSYYSDTPPGSGVNVPEGVNVAQVVPAAAGTQAGFAQVLADAYLAANPSETTYPANHEFIDGVDYQLKVRLGQSARFPATGYRIQLLAGDVVLIEDINSIPVPQDSFVELTLEYIYDPANAYLEGELLKIRLLSMDDISTPVGGGAGMDFDDVRLTYGYTNPLADPGGPYTVTPSRDLFLDGSGSRPADLATIALYEWDLNNDGVFGDVANVEQPEPGGITNVDLIGTYGLKLGDNTIALRITDSSGKESIATTTVRIDYSTVTPGADFVLIANEDGDLDDRWEDLATNNPSGMELLLDDPSVTRQAIASLTQITHAYDFPGGLTGSTGGALLVNSGTTTSGSFQSAPGDWSNNAMTLEIWFKPDDKTIGGATNWYDPDNAANTNGQIIFEDGGSSGLGLFIDNAGNLVCAQDDGDPLIAYSLVGDPDFVLSGPPTDDFIQVVVTRNLVGETTMYINGQPLFSCEVNGAGPVAGEATDDADWSGGDSAGFGTRGGSDAGGLGSGQMNTESFDGQIAIVRLYNEQVLTPAEVLDNYDSVNATDNIPPFIEAYSPADDSTKVLIASSLEATFDSDVTLTGSGTVTLMNLSGGSNIEIPLPDPTQVELNGRVLSITPTSGLAYGTDYAVRITNNAITDTSASLNAFTGILDNVTWNFSTVVEDLTPPVLVSMNPPDNAFDVSPVGAVLQAFFDDDILAGSGNIEIFELDPETMTALLPAHATIDVEDSSQISIADNVLSIAPLQPLLGGTPYAVRIATTAITNTTGTSFAGIVDDTTWNFQMGDPLFSDGFEFPDVTVGESGADTSQRVLDATDATAQNPAKWVMSNVGVDVDLRGIVDEGSGQVTDPTGQQAFAFRAGNAGLTTAKDLIGDLVAGVTYRIAFDVVEDGLSNGRAYDLSLVTFDNADLDDDREDTIVVANGTTAVLHTVTGSAPAGGAYQRVSFEYTVPQGHAALGDDVALRFMGSSSSAMIDNVSVALATTPDDFPPYVLSYFNDVSGGPIVVNDEVIYIITFSEDIQSVSVSAGDFSNAGTSEITIGEIVEVAFGSTSLPDGTSGVFRVPVTPTTVGTLQLQIPEGAQILDMGANAMDTSSADVDSAVIIVNTDQPNNAPDFTDDPFSTADANEDEAYSASIAGSATDLDGGDVLTYSKVDGPEWLIVAGDGTLSGTPGNDDVGLNVFTVGVNDGKLGLPNEATLNVTVINTNDAPAFNSDPIVGSDATEDEAYSGSLASYVTDIDAGDVLSFAKVSGPDWLLVASDGTLSGTPIDTDVGPNAFTVSVTDGNIASPVEATLNIEVLLFNDVPFVDAGDDVYVNLISAATEGWTFAPWTGDADSGISSDYTYTVAHSFGNNNASGVTVNGVAFTENFNGFGPGWNITAGNQNNWNGNDDAVVSGQSEKLAQEFIYNGNPRKLTFSGLTPGKAYEANFYSVAWETGNRIQTFSATGAGLTDAVINQDAYNNNNGIRITCAYVATDTTQEFVITPTTGTFHLYAMSNHETLLSGAVVDLDGFASDEEGGSLTYEWTNTGTGTGVGIVSFTDDSILDPTATFDQTGSYVLRLTADDGNSSYHDDVTIYVVEDFTAPTLASSHIVDDQGGSSVSTGATVTYTITFSEDMNLGTFGATDFTNAGTSNITVGAITKTSPGVFTLEVTPTTTGTLQLQVASGAVLTDLVGNALDTTAAITDDTTITVSESVDPYVTWTAGPFDGTLSNTDTAADFDGGGLATGLEWVLGGDPTLASDDNGIRPTFDGTSDPNNVTFVFRRADAANTDPNTSIVVQYGSDMAFGSTAQDGQDGVSFAVNDDGGGSGVDIVTVTIPKSLATGGKMFVRLSVTVTTP